MMVEEPTPEQFNKPNMPVAVLLEGRFESVFKNRLTSMIKQDQSIKFRDEGKRTKMIVVSDGDVMRNHIIQMERISQLDLTSTRVSICNKKFL